MHIGDLKHTNQTLQNKLEQIYRLKTGDKIALGFRQPYLDLLKEFDNPHLKLPPTIHVAGTNGKGSTIAMLRAIYEAAGYNIHTYTSPHLINFNERIVLQGTPIDDAALEDLLDKAIKLNNDQGCTFFELTTAMAFAAFAQTPADILLLETGLGGRLDCTNIITDPILTIITSIGIDHTEFLGETLTQIASEKAGIMKSSAPCILAHQTDPTITQALQSIADSKKIKTITSTTDKPPALNLTGTHQIQNAQTALTAIAALRVRLAVTQNHIKTGLQNIHWPARMQNITAMYPAPLPQGTEIWLDGGHNQDAAQTLINQIKTWKSGAPKDLHLIIGMMPHKDGRAFISALQNHVQNIHIVPIAAQTQQSELVPTHPSPQSAIHEILKQSTGPNRILIAGSLYLAGQLLQLCRA